MLVNTAPDLNDKFADFIISAEMPFTVVKLPEFVTFCKALNPHYSLPSIYKLKNKILSQKRELGDEQLREELKLSPYVTITIDGWTTRSLISMMGIIVHYQPEIIPKANVLAIEFFKGSHTGERIAQFTLNICQYWGITNKLVRIGADNGANMIKAFADFSEELGFDETDIVDNECTDAEDSEDLDEIDSSLLLDAVKHISQELAGSFPESLLVRLRREGLLQMWFPCVCHTAQLGVKDFLASNLGHRGKVNAIVSKTQSFVTSAKNSTKCAEVFSDKSFNLSVMNKTRWSSMYKMLLSIIDAEDKNLLGELPKLKRDPPTKYELNILREVCDILQPVALFSNEMQATHGTSGMLIPALNIVSKELSDMNNDNTNDSNSAMGISLSEVLNNILKKRFSAILSDKFYWISTSLDPRFGTEALQNNDYLHALKCALKILLDLERKTWQASNSYSVENSIPKEEPPLKRRKSLFPRQVMRKGTREISSFYGYY